MYNCTVQIRNGKHKLKYYLSDTKNKMHEKEPEMQENKRLSTKPTIIVIVLEVLHFIKPDFLKGISFNQPITVHSLVKLSLKKFNSVQIPTF
jgi:hypothetical protein